MKVQILLGDYVINTQIISTETMTAKPSLSDVNRLALQAALQDKQIRISESIRATFKLFDTSGEPIDE